MPDAVACDQESHSLSTTLLPLGVAMIFHASLELLGVLLSIQKPIQEHRQGCDLGVGLISYGHVPVCQVVHLSRDLLLALTATMIWSHLLMPSMTSWRREPYMVR